MTLNIRATYFYRTAILLTLLTMASCVDPYATDAIDFEDVLVVEATITDEVKHQQIFLSRTYGLELERVLPEQGAQVQVMAGGDIFSFTETSPGVYLSQEEFAAQPGIDYQLMITQGERSYLSKNVTLPQATQIDDLKAEYITDEDGYEGVGIYIDSYNPDGNSRNYRYEYEETYKIVAPNWTAEELIVPVEGSCGVELVNDDHSAKECFMTDRSTSIIQYSTSNLAEDRVEKFMLRNISRDNYIISHRYSILVRQYVQSNEAFAYYEALNTFSGQESVFSGAQPGYFQGNIFSNENPDEKIIGFFEVSSVSEKRIFFNYLDHFPEGNRASYAEDCLPYAPLIADWGTCILSVLIENNAVRYLEENEPSEPTDGEGSLEGPYLVVPVKCGDCSVVGAVEAPEYWID